MSWHEYDRCRVCYLPLDPAGVEGEDWGVCECPPGTPYAPPGELYLYGNFPPSENPEEGED